MQKSKLIIAFSHSNYLIKSTGTEKCMREMKSLLIRNEIHTLQVFSFYNKIYRGFKNNQYIGINLDEKFLGIYKISQLKDLIDKICTDNNMIPNGIHIHHLLNYSLDNLHNTIREINLPITMFIHDYYTICSSSNLINSDNEFCDLTFPSDVKCKDCLYYSTAKEHIKLVSKFLTSIDHNLKSIVVPSKYVYDSWTNLYSIYRKRTFIRNHLVFEGIYNKISVLNKDKVRIAFIGGQLVNKGYLEWKKIVCELSKYNEYEFYYFGTGSEEIENVKSVRVSVAKDGPNAMVDALRNNGIDIAMLWSLGPETYSYVYFEASAADCCVISNTISGNIKTMIEENRNGLIFKSTEEFLDSFSNIDFVKHYLKKFEKNNTFKPLYSNPNDSLNNIVFDNKTEFIKRNKHIKPKRMITYLYEKKLNLK